MQPCKAEIYLRGAKRASVAGFNHNTMTLSILLIAQTEVLSDIYA